MMMTRSALIGLVLLAASAAGQERRSVRPAGRPEPAPFSVVEKTIPEMRAAMEQGRLTSRDLVREYLLRLAVYEDRLNAAITVNPHALEKAAARDRERAAGKVRGPLHGIPIALKDNIHTTDMPTTGGALAFEHVIAPYEATLTNRSEEHTSELQSLAYLVCRLLLEKKKKNKHILQ